MTEDLSPYKTIIEPFRIKSVEPIRMTTRSDRLTFIREAELNLFALRASDILIDLLTDSGTNAMSAKQWGRIMEGDESYAGSESFFQFRNAIQDIFGFEHVIPTHQGRAAEKILFAIIAGKGKVIPNNTHFDTTRANIEFTGAVALDCVVDDAYDSAAILPFKGNMDLRKLEAVIKEYGPKQIPAVMITITNNSCAGQPVSLENIRAVSAVAKRHGIPFYIDACRFAENAFFIKTREHGYEDKQPIDIAREIFRLADGCLMSAKKDGLANIGGFLALRDSRLADEARRLLILTEGFPTYGGLAGRDLAAIAQGLYEALEPDYLNYRIVSTKYVADRLAAADVPLFLPAGGHAIYLDVRRFLPHIAPSQLPGQALAVALYVEGGIRGCEIGSVMFGHEDPKTKQEVPAKYEMLRLAIPRRVYTQSHMDYVIEVITHVFKNRDRIKGLKFKHKPSTLRHFTATFEEI